MNLDVRIFSWIHGLSGESGIADQIGVFFADHFMFVFGVVVLLLWFVQGYRQNVLLAIGNVVFSRLIIVEIIKRVVSRPRPFEVMDIKNLVPEDLMMSFPSGHTVIYFSLAFAFWKTKLFWPFFALAVVGSLARIYVGVHYPTDILGSFLIAVIVAVLIARLFKKLKIV